MSNKRKNKRLTTKFSQEAQALHLWREDLQLKQQLLQKFEESDKRSPENLNSTNAIMSNIGVGIQPSVGILGQLLIPRNQIPSNPIQHMYTPMNFQTPQPFQQICSNSGVYSQRGKEVMLQMKLALKIKKPIVSSKNKKVRENLVIIMLFMCDENFFAE